MLSLRITTVLVGTALVLAACGGGGGGSTDDETSEPTDIGEPEETSEPAADETSEPAGGDTEPGANEPGTYTSGSLTGTISGDATADLDVALSEGLTSYLPGMEEAGLPNVANLQFGTLDAPPWVLMALSDGDPATYPGALSIIVEGGAAYTYDPAESTCTFTIDELGSAAVNGSVSCTGIMADDDSGKIDLEAEFTATK